MIEENSKKVINTSKIRSIINNEDIGIYEITNVIELLRKGKLEIIAGFNKENNSNLNISKISNFKEEMEKDEVNKKIEALQSEIGKLKKHLKGIHGNNIENIKALKNEIEDTDKYTKPINLENEIEYIEEANNREIDEAYVIKCKELCFFYNRIILFNKCHNIKFLIKHINEYIKEETSIIKETIYYRERKYRNHENDMDFIPGINKYKTKINKLLVLNENKRLAIFKEPLTTRLESVYDLLQSNYEDKKQLQDFYKKFTQNIELPNYVISENFRRLFNLSRENVLLLINKYKILELFSIVKEIQTKFKRGIFYKLNTERNFFVNEYEECFEELIQFTEKDLESWEQKMEYEIKNKEEKEKENLMLNEKVKDLITKLEEMRTQNEIVSKKYDLLNSKINSLKTEENDTDLELSKHKSQMKEYLAKHNQELSLEETLFLFKEYEEYKNIFMCTNCKENEVNMCIKTCMHVFCEFCIHKMKGCCKKCNTKFKTKDLSKIYF